MLDKTRKRGLGKKFFWVFIVFILLLVSFFAGAYFSEKSRLLGQLAQETNVYLGTVNGQYNIDDQGRLSQNVEFDLYWRLWDLLKRNYVDGEKITDKELFYGSLRGLTESLGDPYTVFLNPQETKEFNNDLAGTFEGIGAEIGIRKGVLTIIAPLAGMPAEKAGLKSGDQILAINGTSTAPLTADDAVILIRGPKGTPVNLTIYREGFNEARDFEIIRDTIYVKSVETEMRGDGLYVIRVSNFNGDTGELFNEAVFDILNKNPKGIILDLRNNPGGFFETAVQMAGEWIEGTGAAVIEKFGDGTEEEYSAAGRARLSEYKTAVLVNRGSASASEIVAGALKDYGLAVIVGGKTYGKGSVQSLEDLSDGSTLKITIAKWLTPNGNSINDEGITPDVEIEFTEEDYLAGRDPQLDKAVEILLGK